jgi:hypothetical protein
LSKALKWSSNLDNESARWSGQPCHQPPNFFNLSIQEWRPFFLANL